MSQTSKPAKKKKKKLLTEPLSVLLVDTLRWNIRAGSVSFSLSDDSSATDPATPAGDVRGARFFFFESSSFDIFLAFIRVRLSPITAAFIFDCRSTDSTRQTFLYYYFSLPRFSCRVYLSLIKLYISRSPSSPLSLIPSRQYYFHSMESIDCGELNR